MVEVIILFVVLFFLGWFFNFFDFPIGRKKKFKMNNWGGHTLKKVCSSCNKAGTSGEGAIENIPYRVKIEHNVSFVVLVEHRIPTEGWIEIKKENMLSKLKKDFGKEDFLIGDRTFDETMLLKGENSHDLAALLSKNVRKRAIGLSKQADSFRISQSGVTASRDDLSISIESLKALIRKTVYLSRDLGVAGNDQKRIIQNVLTDPVPGVRLTNLKILGSSYPSSVELDEVYEKVLKDSSIEMRIEAAALLNHKGLPHIVEILRKKIKKIPSPVVVRAVELLQKSSYRESYDVLKSLYAKRTEPDIRIALLKAFETFGDDELSVFLVNRLYEPDKGVLIHIIKALGTCGKGDAMKGLYRISKNTTDSKIREETVSSMARIESRSSTDKGWLSVSEQTDVDGALSVADDEAEGGLSLTDRKAGSSKKMPAGDN